MDIAQALEDVLEELVSIQKEVNKLKTASVSGRPCGSASRNAQGLVAGRGACWRPATSLTPRSFKRFQALGRRW